MLISIYTLLTVLGILFSLSEISIRSLKYNSIFKKIILAIFCVFIFYVAGFRTVGYDYISYQYIYDMIQTNSGNWFGNLFLLTIEPGYAFLNLIAPSYKIFVAIYTFIALVLLYRLLHIYSKAPIFSLFLYTGVALLGGLMGQQRQAFAVILGMFAVLNIDSKKYYVYLFLACMFHYSAIILIISKIIPNKHIKYSQYLILTVAAIIINYTLQPLYSGIISLLPGIYSEKLLTYESMETGVNVAFRVTTLMRLFVLWIICNYRYRLKDLNNQNYLINFYYLSLFISIAIGFAPQMSIRGTSYFGIMEIILIGNILFHISGNIRYLYYVIFIIITILRVCNFLSTYSMGGDSNVNYLPYTNWLF